MKHLAKTLMIALAALAALALAAAAQAEDIPLWVGSTQVTSANKDFSSDNDAYIVGLTVTAVNYESVYDATAHYGGGTPSITEGTTLVYSTDGGSSWSETAPSITNVGKVSYRVKASNPNYADAEANGTLTVKPAANPVQVNDTATVKVGGNSIDLKENISSAEGGLSFTIDSYTASCNLTASGVLTSGQETGTCTVKVNVNGNGNYESASGTITVTIVGKDTGALADVTQDDVIYGDTLPDPSYVKPVSGGMETFIYSGTNTAGTTYGPTVDKPTEAGRYVVAVTYETHDSIYSGSASFSINP